MGRKKKPAVVRCLVCGIKATVELNEHAALCDNIACHTWYKGHMHRVINALEEDKGEKVCQE